MSTFIIQLSRNHKVNPLTAADLYIFILLVMKNKNNYVNLFILHNSINTIFIYRYNLHILVQN